MSSVNLKMETPDGILRDTICETPLEVISSNIGKRIITLILHQRVEPEVRDSINIKLLVERAFDSSKNLSEDEKNFLLTLVDRETQRLQSDYSTQPNNVRNESSIESAKRIFNGLLIQGTNESGLKERINTLGAKNEYNPVMWERYLESLKAVINTNNPDNSDDIQELATEYNSTGKLDSITIMLNGVSYIPINRAYDDEPGNNKYYRGSDDSTLVIFSGKVEKNVVIPYKIDEAQLFGDIVVYRYGDQKGVQKIGSTTAILEERKFISNPDDGKVLVSDGNTFWLMDISGEKAEQYDRIGFTKTKLLGAIKTKLDLEQLDGIEYQNENGFMLITEANGELGIIIKKLNNRNSTLKERVSGHSKRTVEETNIFLPFSKIK